jgi:hypothetical protein
MQQWCKSWRLMIRRWSEQRRQTFSYKLKPISAEHAENSQEPQDCEPSSPDQQLFPSRVENCAYKDNLEEQEVEGPVVHVLR